ncbi:50S ribosomal protein L17 [Mesomycoplasma hyopneumoniae]|uniref:Large ribosomal subunit protein bL17 n=1 Tax=Mesomycoplasma hyopneumoniae (strain J / ATCC 25934 / NCTC 10110) TaxID=262719 RepID=RL17_MESHJ|nr:50S ribosomal protein L17 [Mesomycoplasma hyopneumoniae]Q4AAG7.1 RecName: Full=Large ribosomal subunit protein bL17; AltName: Full=50S ribosomal protein L17 [Mesomycoplasma hyopneumoniae J]AAZ44254.1 50S ribosomal protein L17 [Mesomycoplasma hyopneumoniae J]QLG43297.1 50S ribosomal protein L17 [Mesomycoplasma hyopneumoniae]
MANPHQIYRHDAAWDRQVFRSLATSLILHGHIKTTLDRAKRLRSVVEKLITKAKKNDLAARRQILSFLYGLKTRDGVKVMPYLFNKVAPRYQERNGGYTRIVRIPSRLGDNSKMAIIELV